MSFFEIMVYHSSLSTPDGTPLIREVIEVSTAWSDVLLEDLQTTFQFNPPSRMIRGYGQMSYATFRTRLRGWGRVLWLSMFVVVGLWWVFQRDTHYRFRDGTKIELDLPRLDGLQFIDSNHPYIRVCYALVTDVPLLI